MGGNPGKGKLEVHYTAIRLRSAERTRFKYWMEGFEPDWTDAGQRRVAYYTYVPAGDYRFHVVAYEMDDPRNAAEQILELGWRPHFYDTSWFLPYRSATSDSDYLVTLFCVSSMSPGYIKASRPRSPVRLRTTSSTG